MTWSCKGVACDNCDLWYHISCIDLCSNDYDLLQRSNVQWICPKCDSINCDTFTFHSYELSCSNYYHPLSEGNQTIDSITSNTSTFSPLKASSPKPRKHPPTSSHHPTDRQTPEHTSSLPPSHPSPSSHHTNSTNAYNLPKKNNLRILTLNCQSIIGKTAEFAAAIDYIKPDIICGTESWLHGEKPNAPPTSDHIKSSEIFPDNYNIFRNDRSRLGGGVFILVHKSLTVVEQPNLTTACEILWVKLKLQSTKDLYIASFYMPHRNEHDIKQLEKSMNLLTDNGKKQRQTIIAGDFNCPDINWSQHTTNSTGKDNTIQQALINTTSSFTLTQVHHTPTRQHNILDLVFFSNPSLVKSSISVPGISDHDMVVTDSDIKPHRTAPTTKKCYKFYKADWNNLRANCDEITEQIHHQAQSNSNIEHLWTYFKTALLKAIDTHIPHSMKSKRHHLPWLNTSLKRMLRKKNRLLTQAKKTNNWSTYKFHQKECKRQIKKAERNYINTTIQEGLQNNNTKPYWHYIKARRQDNIGVAPLKEQGQLFSDSKNKARILLNQFKSVFTTDTNTAMPQVHKKCSQNITPITVRTEGVQKLLQHLKPHKASGPDQIPNIVLKECAKNLAPAITLMFQLSLDTGDLPQDWLNANVACVHKKGDKHSPENYRPISLTSVTCKLLEHIIYRHMLNHLQNHNILTHLNHGFRSGFSCETQLLLTTHDLLRSFDQKHQVDIAILDFSKAFDTVPHKRLLHKLQEYGIRGPLHTWLSNFLQHRKMAVAIEGTTSDETPVKSGVPQGTVLGPLLFLCHINDLPDRVKSQVRLFADDCLLYRTINSHQDHIQLQDDLHQLETWATDWGMKFNPKKCYILSIQKSTHYLYTLCNTPLEHVQSNPYLGITLSHDMKWSTHIANITKKANSTLGFLRRNLRFCPQQCKKNAYLSLVRPILEYGCIIWDPYQKQDIDKLEKTQRLSARFITGDYTSRTPGSITKMLHTLQLPTLQQRRKDTRLIFLFRVVEGLVPAIPPTELLTPNKPGRLIKPTTTSDHHTTNTINNHIRNNNRTFTVSRCRTDQYKHSFFISTIIDWNHLDEETVTTPSFEQFKQKIQQHQ